MAIDIKDRDQRAKLAKAIKMSWERGGCERERRADLKRIFEDRSTISDLILQDRQRQAYLNLFSLFVRGHIINLAYRSPRFSVNAQTPEAKGFDKRAQSALERYNYILNIASLVERWALDSAFGRAVAKVCTSIAPKGITSPTAPRCFRINPDYYIPDRSAPHRDEMTYCCDLYFVDLDEAKKHEHFNAERRAELHAWGDTSGSGAYLQNSNDADMFATAQTRLIDVYIPTLGKIYTWPCSSDSFSEISSQEPLQELESAINPYKQLDLEFVPDSLSEISRLGQLRPLNMLANDNYTKVALQAKYSQRNPIAMVGDEMEMDALLRRPDGEPAFLNNPKAVDVFQIPGPDGSILGLAKDAANTFSEHGGNLNTALGISPGASTARQTQALIGQISQAQAVDRMKFERFLNEIATGTLTLMFEDEALQFSYTAKMPGMKWHNMNAGWADPIKLPRVGEISDYVVETVAYSTAFRGPQERLGQLTQASDLVFKMMMQKAQGAPLDIEAIIDDAADSFDLIPNLRDWYSGQEPTPAQKTGQTYQSMAGPSQGSDVNYNSNAGGGQGGEFAIAEQPAGLASGGGAM